MSVDIEGCAKGCDSPMIYVSCLCQQTCDSLAKSKGIKKCAKTCFPGCQCPESMVNENGKCIQKSACPCSYKGVLYSFGEKIYTDDPCRRLICTKKSLQEKILENCTSICLGGMKPCPCASCHKTCDTNNLLANCDLKACKSGCCCPKGTIFSEVLKRCVNNCPCIYENKTYEIGESWTNRCLKCKCDKEKRAVCKEDGCNFDVCPPRQRLVNDSPNDNVCCKCVNIDPTCHFNGKEYAIGEVWSEGPCLSMKCLMEAGTIMVSTEPVECGTIRCINNMHLTYIPGRCCPSCVARNIATTKAGPTTKDPSTERCRVRYTHKVVKQRRCTSLKTLKFGHCEGTCFGRSKIIVEREHFKISKQCSCCKPKTSLAKIQYRCPEGLKRLGTLRITKCTCSRCH